MLRSASIFQDHMVLQQGKPVTVWGECEGEEEILVSVGEVCVKTRSSGRDWRAVLPPLPATENTTLTISAGAQCIRFADIAVGEVWFAGGQSNMEFYLRYDKDRDATVPDPQIRMFDFPKISYAGEQEEYDYSDFGKWRKFTPENRDYFSATAFYFAALLRSRLKVPVGIVCCTWGATPACAWLDPRLLEENEGSVWLDDYREAIRTLDLQQYELNFRCNPDNYKGKPFSNPMQEKMMFGMTAEELMAWIGEMRQSGITPVVPIEGPKSEKRPGGLFETMIRQAAPYTVRGFIWYQGENDDRHPEVYHIVLSRLIQCWRELWGEPLPFLFVQLAPFSYWTEEGRFIFPLIREKQQWVSDHTEQCWMACMMDHGMEHDIHPKEKRFAGQRLALLALGHVYHQKLLSDSPRYDHCTASSGRIELYFRHVGEELLCREGRVSAFQVEVNGQNVSDFGIRVMGKTLVLTHPLFCRGNTVRIQFAQKDYCIVNLYNSAQLPLLPFVCEAMVNK